MRFNIWHYEIDTLPRFEKEGESYNLYMPVGVYPYTNERVNVIIEFKINDSDIKRIGFNRNNPLGVITPITEEFINCLRIHNPRQVRHFLNMGNSILEKRNLYYEGLIKGIDENSYIQYKIGVYPKDSLASYSEWYKVYVKKPDFKFDDIKCITEDDDTAERTNVIYYKEDSLFHHVRIDYVNISVDIPRDFHLEINGMNFSFNNTKDLPWLPIINFLHDYITLSIPKSEVPKIEEFSWKGKNIDLAAAKNVGKARIMFIHYCMQGLNDLFEQPNKNYAPYRTYMQTTIRDELATYSSRPNSTERFEEDGYMFTLEYHRNYGIKHLWTFNGGVLALIAHDCPNELKYIREDIKNGILDPTIAGFGGHRLPYYQEETNRYSIQYGIDMMNNILGKCNDVYYLDQRLYKQIPNVVEALKKANIKYIVVDASTGFDPHRSSIKANENAVGLYLDHHYLWQDETTGLYVLFIDDEMRNKILGSSEYEYFRGKLVLDLRKKLLYFASHNGIRNKNLIIYSDDADKASGNGWFDGDYSGKEPEFCDMFQSAIEWIAAHPWIEAVASAGLDPKVDCVGTINMKDAICPSVDPGGSTSIDVYGKQIHFDAWYDNWKNFPARWINKSFEEISQEIEFTIINWPALYQNQLYELGKMTFSMYLHESQWNKQPLELDDPNRRNDVIEPEDFVISATLQLRNAQVYLNASLWAEWAKGQTKDDIFCNNGPVINIINGLGLGLKGTHWDRDPLENVIMYNRFVLIVMDQNGGRITHIFVMKDNKPYCVSGTMKCYQYLTGEKLVGENVICDGELLQNNVYTPNHAYVACDLRESRTAGIVGKKYNPKTGVNKEMDCYYPDNFNAYKYSILKPNMVEWIYSKTTEPPKQFNLGLFYMFLHQDREEKKRGQYGIVFHPLQDFKKKILLENKTLFIDYFGVSPGHLVANEFTIGLYRSIMFGEKNIRKQLNENAIELSSLNGLKIKVTLGNNCQFNEDTLQGDKNLRLHRVLTDCIEIESPKGNNFSYEIHFFD